MHPRISVSAISTYRWTLEEDLAFYTGTGITNVGISAAKLDQHGWADGVRRVAASGVSVANLIGLGPFQLGQPAQWAGQRERLERAVDAASTLGADCMVFTTGPAGQLTWEDAADALAAALAPTLQRASDARVPFAIEHTNSLRVDVGFVHTLADVIDLARRLGTGVCMEVNACWAERSLARTITTGIDVVRLVQVSDFGIGTMSTPNRLVPGDGDIPLERILGDVLDAGYAGVFDLELIGPAIEEEGYRSAVPRAVDRLTDLLDRFGV
jgi:sugar phosphate isomerase/epimerase